MMPALIRVVRKTVRSAEAKTARITARITRRRGERRTACLKVGQILFFTCFSWTAAAESAEQELFLDGLRAALSSSGVLVSNNLNARNVAGPRPDKPRLGGFGDLPVGRFPNTREILQWEADFTSREIAAVAVLVCSECDPAMSDKRFLANWLQADAPDRVFLTYHRENFSWAELIAAAALSEGYSVKHLTEGDVAVAGELYATLGRSLGLDTRVARSSKSDVAEISFLGKRARRNSHSIFKSTDSQRGRGVARNEPANFLKETLGDEYTQSTIREVIVPGGVALGETAALALTLSALEFDGQQLIVVDEESKRWRLPAQAIAITKSLFDFVRRSNQLRSDAIVDIDGDGKVRISSALRDTDAGYQIMQADTQPFQYVRNLDVTKSVIIDTSVEWLAADTDSLQFNSEFEVRFLSADNMRIAQTRVALIYAYDSLEGTSRYREAWGRDAQRLNKNLDTAGLGSSLSTVAEYSGWVALFRTLDASDAEFLQGRYQFMKVDAAGRSTPSRY